jgi:cell division cycle 14
MNLKDIEQTMGPIYKTVIDYRTEGEGVCDHHISIMDCLRGLQMAFNHLPTLEMEAFDVDNLLWMEQPQNGDLNWIVPGRLLALAGPTTQNWPIEKFIEYAQSNSIGCMVRLNRPHYPAANVIRSGTIEHIEMFMHDGTNPSEQNIRDFIVLVDRMNSQNRGVAVHCRAGLGRTGTMIAAYLLFQYSRDLKRSPGHGNSDCSCLSLTPPEIARAIIGFLRIMRPGSVLSGQPEFLESIAEIVYTAGAENDVNLIAQFSAEESELSVTDSIEEESQIIESISSSASSIEEEEEETLVIRTSKRLKLSTSAASIDKFKQVRHHPISHAGRGHAAEKHSSVQVEKI